MPDYKNGKIYVIKSYETNDVYVGSTCRPLKQRFSRHKSEYKRKVKDEIIGGTTIKYWGYNYKVY